MTRPFKHLIGTKFVDLRDRTIVTVVGHDSGFPEDKWYSLVNEDGDFSACSKERLEDEKHFMPLVEIPGVDLTNEALTNEALTNEALKKYFSLTKPDLNDETK